MGTCKCIASLSLFGELTRACSLPFFSVQHLFWENPINASEKTSTVLEKSRYMDDDLFLSDFLSELVTMSCESIELFKSRRFKLKKWVANSNAKTIRSEVPKSDHTTNISEIAIGSEQSRMQKYWVLFGM